MNNVLIISPEEWNGHFVSKHHYAITLAKKGARVYFLDPPKSEINDIKILNTDYENLYQVQSPIVSKGLQYMPKILRINLQRKWLDKLESKIGCEINTVWLFENSRFYDLDFAKDRLKIYHQVDLNQNFHIKEASKSADISFCTTDYIKYEIEKYSKKVYKIHHGVANVDAKKLTENQNELFTKRKINVAYIGNLDIPYLDIDILGSLFKKYSNITFHLVGSYSENKNLFKKYGKLDNIVWWKKVESNLIPSILQKSDILLLAYRANNDFEKKQLASPHKLMEYLSSGKVVMSTYTDEYKDRRNLLEMVDDPKDYLDRFEQVVNNLAFYNSYEKMKERIDFAKSHSYSNQLEKINKLVKQNTNKVLL